MTEATQFPVYSISISGTLSWQLHALNNEGNEGNQSLTRRYYVIDKSNPEPQYVNGVSGDMLKHIQAEHIHRIAIESNLSLSEGGKRFSPDRVGYDLDKEQMAIIGYNPHSFNYSIDTAERKKRLDALLKSVLYTFLQPNGAKRNTHLPHPDGFSGVITVSTKRCPAPMVSPLQPDFERQIDSLEKTLNRINGENTILKYEFADLAQFAEKIETLIQQAQPWESDHAEAGE